MIISCALRTLYLPEVTQNTVLCILSPGLLLWDKCWGKEKIICIPFSQVCFYRLWQPLCKPSAVARETSWGATARVEQGQALAPVHEDTHLQAASGSGVTGRSAPKPKCRGLWQITCAINVSVLTVTSCYGWMWVGPLHTRNCVMETQKVGSKKGFAGY